MSRTREEIEAAFPLRSKVVVRLGYQGGGIYAPDGWEGEWYVVGYCGSQAHGYVDLQIAHHPDDDYQGIVHLCRVRGARESLADEARERRWRESHGLTFKGLASDGWTYKDAR